MSRFLQRAKQVAALVGITTTVAVCGASTIRGGEALFSGNARVRPMADAIASGALPPGLPPC